MRLLLPRVQAEVRATVRHSGPCHALVMFMEYHSSAEAALAGRPPIASGAPRLDAGPSPHVQVVYSPPPSRATGRLMLCDTCVMFIGT